MQLISLEEQYRYYLNQFREQGTNPHPSALLALLLLQDKDKYLSLSGNLEDFYNYYKNEIDKKINQVMIDFDLTKEDIIDYANAFVVNESDEINYEETAFWNVFINGIIVLQWGIMFHQELSSEQIYNTFFTYFGRSLTTDSLIKGTIEQQKNRKKVK